MKTTWNPCECGCSEFITQPNQYGIYEVIDGRLEFQRTELIDNELILYCRECSKEYKESDFMEAVKD